MSNRVSQFPALIRRLTADNNLTRKAYLNAIAAGVDYFARLVVGFVINPLLVNGLGDFFFGVWQVLSKTTSYLSAAGGRPTQALKWTIANQQASTDYEAKRRNVGSAIVAWAIFIPVLGIIGGLVAWFIPAFLDAAPEHVNTVRLAAAILVVNLLLINLTDVPRSVLRGENLGYKRMGLSAALVLIGGGLIALAIYFEQGLLGVSAALVCNTILTGVLFYAVMKRYVSWFGVARPQREEVVHFVQLSGWFLLWRLILQLIMSGDIVLLGFLDSAESVTPYTLTKYAPQTLIGLIAIVVTSVTPGLGGIMSSGKLKQATQVRGELMLLSWVIITVTGATILLWNPTFVSLWVAPEYFAGQAQLLLITLMTAQFVLIRNDANIIDLTLDLKHKVILGLFSLLISISLSIILVARLEWGIIGLCLSFIAGRFLLTISYPIIVGRFLNLQLSKQIKYTIRPLFVTIALWAVALFFSDQLSALSWFQLLLRLIPTLLVTATFAILLGVSAKQRQSLLRRIQTVLAR